MDLDQLQSVRDRERQTDSLQQLRDSFYADAGEFIAELQAERDAVAAEAEDPFRSPEVRHLSNRIQTAEQTVEAIYEQRVGKIVKAATFAAADLPAEADGLTTEERELFDALVAEIERNRETVLDVLGTTASDSRAGEGATPGRDDAEGPPDGRAAESGEEVGDGAGMPDERVDGSDARAETGAVPSADEDGDVAAADAMGGDDPRPARDDADGAPTSPAPPGREPPEPDAPAPEPPALDPDVEDDAPGGDAALGDGQAVDGEAPDAGEGAVGPDGEDEDAGGDVQRRTVRITTDVGRILGVDDREYDLAEDDVVSLPVPNAEPLLEGDAAEPIE